MKTSFRDESVLSYQVNSSWKSKSKQRCTNADTQTTFEDYFDNSTQTGISTDIIQDVIKSKNSVVVLDHIASMPSLDYSKQDLTSYIIDGSLVIDNQTITDPFHKCEDNSYIELIIMKRDTSTQTEPFKNSTEYTDNNNHQLSKSLDFLRKVSPLMEKMLQDSIPSSAFDTIGFGFTDTQIIPEVLLWKILTVDLIKSKVVYADMTNAKYQTGRIYLASVSRNKERIYDIDFDDGSKQQGVKEEYIRLIIKNSNNNNNSNNAYQNSYDDKKKLALLKEGIRVHFKLTNNNNNNSGNNTSTTRGNKNSASTSSSSSSTSTSTKNIIYYPGRIIECHKTSGSYSIEYEKGTVHNIVAEDIVIGGLNTGQYIEAKKPEYVKLECTSLSWNTTGNSVVASFGKLSTIVGWNHHPGAMCTWNIFNNNRISSNNNNNLNNNNNNNTSSSTNNNDNNNNMNSGNNNSINNVPNNILDHSTCITTLAYPPEMPSYVIAGSYNGEVMLWDLVKPDTLIAISPISFYTHNGPVKQVAWFKKPSSINNSSNTGRNKNTKSEEKEESKNNNTVISATTDITDDPWLIVSVGTDGKILFWSVTKGLQTPLKGSMIIDNENNNINGNSKKQQAFHSISCLAISSDTKSNNSSSASTNVSDSATALWIIIGLECGKILRMSLDKIFKHSPIVTQIMIRDSLQLEEMYPPLSRHDIISYTPHIGPVNRIDISPFHRNLFLSAGDDGLLRLYHVFDKIPLQQWEPTSTSTVSTTASNTISNSASSSSSAATSAVQTSLTCCQFSSIRPCVWSVSSSSGIIYLFDYLVSKVGPVQILDFTTAQLSSSFTTTSSSLLNQKTGDSNYNNPSQSNKRRNNAEEKSIYADKGVGISEIAFNPKQRDFLAASCMNGNIYVWKMSSDYTHKLPQEQFILDELGKMNNSSSNNGNS